MGTRRGGRPEVRSVDSGPAAPGASGDGPRILHDRHFDGRLGEAEDDDEMVIASDWTPIEEREAARGHAVFLGNDEDLIRSLIGLVHDGKSMIEGLSEVESLAIAVGTHELDGGVDIAAKR